MDDTGEGPMTRSGARRRLGKPCGIAAALLLACSTGSFGGEAEQPPVGTLTVVSAGFEGEEGAVMIRLSNSREDFEADDAGFRNAKVEASGGKATAIFEALPYGEYAIQLFHDENSNGELDIGWMGPEEAYGFSNDARGVMGPPDWDDAKFTLSAPELTTTIEAE